MAQCPIHTKQLLNLVCITQSCPNRGAICQACAIDHKNHKIQQIEQTLADSQRVDVITDNDVKEEENLQQKVLHQLDDLKKNIINAIARLQINSQLLFQQELQVRKVLVSDQQRQKELIKSLQSQNLNGTQVQDRILELLHRQQAKHAPSALHRYQEVSRRIDLQGKDILQTIISLMDVQERQLTKISIDDSTIKSSQQPKGSISQYSGQESSRHQFVGEREIFNPIMVGATPPKFNNSPNPPVVFTSQKSQRSDYNKNYFSEMSQRSDQPSRSKSPIFSTPKRDDTSPKSYINLPPSNSRRLIEQRDLEPVGTYTSTLSNRFNKEDQSKNYISQIVSSKESPQSRYSITLPSPKESTILYVVEEQTVKEQIQVKPTIAVAAYSSPKSEIIFQKQIYDNPAQAKSTIEARSFNNDQTNLHSQIQDQRSRIHQQHRNLDEQKSVFGKSLVPATNDMNASSISNRSATPPPVKREPNLQSQFQQERLLNWRAHDKGIKDLCLMDNDKIISCSGDSTIRIWDKNNSLLKISLEGHEKAVLCLDFHPQKRIIASGSADRTIRVWRPAPTWQSINTLIGHQDRVKSVCFISANLLASGSDDCTIRIWDLDQGGVCAFTIEVGSAQVNEGFGMNSSSSSVSQTTQAHGRVSKILSHQGMIVASSSKHICTWDNSTFKQKHNILAHDNLIISMAIQGSTPQNSLLITGGKDCFIKLWELSSMALIVKVKEDYPAASLSIDPTATYLAVGSFGFEGEGKITLWVLKGQGSVSKVHETFSNVSGCNALIFDNTSTDQKLLIYSAHENKQIEVHSIVKRK